MKKYKNYESEIYKRIEKIETVTLLTFSFTFLYIRLIHFTWIIPQMMYQIYLSSAFSTMHKHIGILNACIIILLGYFWSFKIVKKVYQIVVGKSIQAVKKTI